MELAPPLVAAEDDEDAGDAEDAEDDDDEALADEAELLFDGEEQAARATRAPEPSASPAANLLFMHNLLVAM